MNSKTNNTILLAMLVAVILGAAAGYYLGDIFIHIKFLGILFLNVLKMIVIPLVVTSIIVGISRLGNIRKLGKMAGKTVLFYLATGIVAAIVGLILVNIISPGTGHNPIGGGLREILPEKNGGSLFNVIGDLIAGLIPENIPAAATGGKVLPLVAIAILFGSILVSIGDKGKPVISFFEGIYTAIMKIVILILYIAPAGFFALISSVVAENRETVGRMSGELGMYLLTVILGLLILAAVIFPVVLKMYTRQNPLRYFSGIGQALFSALTTSSSAVALPVTMRNVQENLQIDNKATSFVLPVGTVMNMAGAVLYQTIAAIFIAQVYGVGLSIGMQIVIFLTAMFASIGMVGVSFAGTGIISVLLTVAGLPLEGIGLFVAADWLLARCLAVVNVWGDSICAAVIAETAEVKVYLPPTPRVEPFLPKKKVSGWSKPAAPKIEKRPGPAERREGSKPPQDRKRERGYGEGKGRPGRFGRQDRGARQERGDRKDRGYRQSGRPRVSKEGAPPPTEAIKPEPEKIIEKVGGPVVIEELAKETPEISTEKPPEKGSEKFFDIEFSKIDFFREEAKDVPDKETEAETERPRPEVSESGSEEEVMEPEREPEREEIPSESETDKTESETASGPEKDKDETSEDGDLWGREKKKRPLK